MKRKITLLISSFVGLAALAACGPTETHTHTYGEWQKNDTETHKKLCECGDVVTENHAWNEGEVTTDPTHFAAGEKTFTCEVCGETKVEPVEQISHVYDQEVKNENTLKSAATCEEDAVYYKSCSCGEISTTETFVDEGSKTGHNKSTEWEFDNLEHWHTCANDPNEKLDLASHVYDQNVEKAETLKSAATCEADAVYYKSCVCGVISTTETFTKADSATGHDKATEWSFDENQHWHTCSHDANEKLDLANHTFDQEVKNANTLKSAAGCETDAVYYKSCICGAISTSATFTDVGSKTGHNASIVYDYPTTEKVGHKEYYACSGCNKMWADEGLTTELTSLDSLEIAKSTAAKEINASDLDAGDLIANIYTEGDKTKGLDQTNWPEGGTTCKGTGTWKYYEVDGIKALKASTITLTEAQRALRQSTNSGFSEFRFAITHSDVKYVTFAYKYYDLNEDTTEINLNNVHFTSQQYDGSTYIDCRPVELVADNAWHKATIKFNNASDITYLTMKFFHMNGEFYISNLQVHEAEPVVNRYTFDHSAEILDVMGQPNVVYSIKNDGSENYLKVETTNSDPANIAVTGDFKAGQTVSVVLSYVADDMNTGSPYTVVLHPANKLVALPGDYVIGSNPWDGGWNGSKIKVDVPMNQDCTSVYMNLNFNGSTNAYYKIYEIVVKNDDSLMDFSEPTDIDGVINPQNARVSAVSDANGSFLKVEEVNAGGHAKIGYLKSIKANTKVLIKLEYVTSDPVFVNGSNQFTFLVSRPNNGFGGAADSTTVMGSAPWDGGWNSKEVVVAYTPSQDTNGIFMEFVFNSVENSYFKILGISFANNEGTDFSAPNADWFFRNLSVNTAVSCGNGSVNIRKIAGSDRFNAVAYVNTLPANSHIKLTVAYKTDNAVFTDDNNKAVVDLKALNASLDGSAGDLAFLSSAPWDQNWDGSETVLEFDTTEAISGLLFQLQFNSGANDYFAISNLTITAK